MLRVEQLERMQVWVTPLAWSLLAVVAMSSLRYLLDAQALPEIGPVGSLLLLCSTATLVTLHQRPAIAVGLGLLTLLFAAMLIGPRVAYAWHAQLPPQDAAGTLQVALSLVGVAIGLAGIAVLRAAGRTFGLLMLQTALVVLLLATPSSISVPPEADRLWLPFVAWLSVLALLLMQIRQAHYRTGLATPARPRLWIDLATALALISLAGWVMQSSAVVQVGTHAVPIQFNTALAILCVALAQRHEGEVLKETRLLLLLFPLIVAAAAIFEELAWVRTSLSQLLWTHRIFSESVPPGRVSISTGIALLMLCIATVIRVTARRRPLLGLLEWGCGLMVLVLGFLSVLGYLSGLLDARAWGGHTPMALMTAILLSLLGFAVLLRGLSTGGDWAGRAIVLPIFVALATCVATVRLWLAHIDQLEIPQQSSGVDQWFLFGGLFIAALLAVVVRFALLTGATARAEERSATELRQRNELLRNMLSGRSRESMLGEVLDGLRGRFPTADVSAMFRDGPSWRVLGKPLSAEFREALIDASFVEDAAETRSLQEAAAIGGYPQVRIEAIQVAGQAIAGHLVVLRRDVVAPSATDSSYLRSSANIAALALQHDYTIHQLEQSQERYRSLLDNHPDAVLQLDSKGIIEQSNQTASQLFNRAGDRLPGIALASLLDAASGAVLTARIQAALQGEAQSFEAAAPLPQRRSRDLEVTLVPLSVEVGVRGVYALVRDMSRYRAADRALRRTFEHGLEFRNRLIDLNKVAIELARYEDPRELLRFLTQQMLAGFGVQQARISLDPAYTLDDPMELSASDALDRPELDPRWRELARACATPKRQSQRDLEISAGLQPVSSESAPRVPRNWLGMALVLDRGESIGTVELAGRESGEFDDDDETLLIQYAQLVVGAVLRTRLLHGLSEAQSIAARQLEFVRTMAASIVDGMYAIDQGGRLNFMNPAAERLLACDADQAMGKPFGSVFATPVRGSDDPGMRALLSGRIVSAENLSIQSEIGRVFPVDLLASPMKLDDETIGAVVVFRDISDRLRADEARTERDRFFELSLELFVITDASGRMMQANTAVAKLVGLPLSELSQRLWMDFVHLEDRPATIAVTEALLSTGRLEGFVNRWVDTRGDSHWLEWAAALAPDQRIFAVARDITERHRYESEIAHFSTHDSLTGLPRIELVEAFLVSALAAAAQRGGRLSVFYIDLDRFHAVNDSRGRLIGDLVLRAVAQRLSAAVGENGKLCRVAGDEFVLVRVDSEEGPDQQEMGEALRLIIEEPILLEPEQVFLTCSIGVSCFPENGATSSELIRQAEAAMMRAKDEGRNSVAAFSNSELQALRDRLELGSGLRSAISAEQLVLHFQPQISAHNWQVTGVEALVRWQHPERGLLLPGRFIAVAEELGVIVELGQWVLDAACRHAREWLDSGIADFTVAVNVSALQLQRPDFLERVQQALERSRLPPRYLELELTESMVMAHVERVITTMRSLKALGVSISLDDFGSGYSSLSYLRRFPVDKLKIDQSFVRDITTDPGSAGICRAIIGLGHQLGMTVSAEGVETIGHAGFLRRSECDQFQGNYFSLPLPALQAFDVLRRRYLRQEELGGTLKQAHASNTLLLLDDEENVIRALVRLLRRDGYNIVTATSAEQAFELLANEPVQVIISDQRMPDISGTDFLHKVKELYPATIRLILSGYSDFASLTDAINRGAVYRFVAKPWDDEELRRTIREAFRRVDTGQESRIV
ncbi:MAG: EAL domain-containing protein [Tahibacter sp.]